MRKSGGCIGLTGVITLKILITGAWQDAKTHFAQLSAMGHHIFFLQQECDPLPVDPSEIEGVICNGLFLYHPIQSFSSLRYVQLTSAGYDRMDMQYTDEHKITIRNAKGVYSIPMAEHAVMGVLALYRKLEVFYRQKQLHLWQKERHLQELHQKTICVVGAGSVGCACARLFAAFGCRIIGADIDTSPRPEMDHVYTIEDLPSILPFSDIVILTLPLSDQTRFLFRSEMFSIMKQDSILVNISRGQLVDTDALCLALDSRLLGAVLDVFDPEPLHSDSPLWDKNNVIITPHNSFVGNGNSQRLSQVILNNLENLQGDLES